MDDASLFFDGADGRQIPISRSGQIGPMKRDLDSHKHCPH
jgi:hypothetical protein